METIEEARTETDYESCAELLRAYVAWAQQRYQGLRWIAEIAFDPPSLERELGSLNVRYGPPNGRMFVARCSERPIGVGAYRRLKDNKTCEMKRLFVDPTCQGKGTGRRLCQSLLDAAVKDEYKTMRLDTGHLFTEALGLYESLGFRRCTPFNDYPPTTQPYMAFLERTL